MEFRVAVDRFEGELAVLRPVGDVKTSPGRKTSFLWPKDFLPDGTVEGCHLAVTVTLDPTATAAARARATELLRRLGPTPDRSGAGAGGGEGG